MKSSNTRPISIKFASLPDDIKRQFWNKVKPEDRKMFINVAPKIQNPCLFYAKPSFSNQAGAQYVACGLWIIFTGKSKHSKSLLNLIGLMSQWHHSCAVVTSLAEAQKVFQTYKEGTETEQSQNIESKLD